MKALAPIILFVYNRPWHTEQALNALADNVESKNSILYIYADGPKENPTVAELEKIQLTREVLIKKQWCKEVNVVASERNKGLADSVINGTTEILERYGKVITIEDDVIVGKYFLRFMNSALERYQYQNNVFMVSGYNFPVKENSQNHNSFFMPVSTSQAWGTWERVWRLFDVNAKGYERLKMSYRLRSKFNLDDSYDFSTMLISQMESNFISSWAVRFNWSLFTNKGLILYPDRSLIKNIGWDNSGKHCGGNNPFEDKDWQENYFVDSFPKYAKIDITHFNLLKRYFRTLFPLKKVSFIFRIRNNIIGILPLNFKTRLKRVHQKMKRKHGDDNKLKIE